MTSQIDDVEGVVTPENQEKPKGRLYFVLVCYTLPEGHAAQCSKWIRADDGYRALKTVLDIYKISTQSVWSQTVISFMDFIEIDKLLP